MRIHITGASGSGVTTLGLALAERLGIPAVDADSFYWVPTETPFTKKRDREERLVMVLTELAKCKDAVFSGSCLDWLLLCAHTNIPVGCYCAFGEAASTIACPSTRLRTRPEGAQHR